MYYSQKFKEMKTQEIKTTDIPNLIAKMFKNLDE